jgi:hypothetical protein
MYALYIVIAAVGYRDWRKDYKNTRLGLMGQDQIV